MYLGFLQTGASPTPGQARGKSKAVIPTQGNYGLLDISEFTITYYSFNMKIYIHISSRKLTIDLR